MRCRGSESLHCDMSGPPSGGLDFAEGRTKCGASPTQIKEDEVTSEGALAVRVSASFYSGTAEAFDDACGWHRAGTAFPAVLRHLERKIGLNRLSCAS